MVTNSVRQAPSVQDQPCSLTPFIPRCSARGRAARGRCHDLGWALGSQLKQRTGGEGEEDVGSSGLRSGHGEAGDTRRRLQGAEKF